MSSKTTPIEVYDDVYVKRDDLCFSLPAPPFSKCRGILDHLIKLRYAGIKYVGYTETSVSMAGWGIAWGCKKIGGLTPVIFDPQYKETPELLKVHRQYWNKFEAEIIPIKAGMAKVNYYISKKILKERYPNSIMLPLGLPFQETIEATRLEVVQSDVSKFRSIVSCVGSGTIFTGIYKGLHSLRQDITLYGVLSRSGDTCRLQHKIALKSGIVENGLFSHDYSVEMVLVDPGWQYTERSNAPCPFPCHPYYDLKAWEWLQENKKDLKPPILFWNIGGDQI